MPCECDAVRAGVCALCASRLDYNRLPVPFGGGTGRACWAWSYFCKTKKMAEWKEKEEEMAREVRWQGLGFPRQSMLYGRSDWCPPAPSRASPVRLPPPPPSPEERGTKRRGAGGGGERTNLSDRET